MIDEHVLNKKSIKYYVNRYLQQHKNEWKNKIAIDIPAGNGATTEILSEIGCRVEPYDLFPEYFMLKTPECRRADIVERIPVDDNYADFAICQEGIEHFSDQLKVLKEFNRVLKPGGQLLITTPSYSNLSAKMSYLFFESERVKKMPPNEIDDIWMSDKSITSEIYHGHIFLLGLQKLRVLGKLAGFRIKSIEYVRPSKGSVFLLFLFYPVIYLGSLRVYKRNLKKHKDLPSDYVKAVYHEQLKMNISVRNLINKHTFIVYEKEKNHQDVDFRQENLVKPFDKIM